MKVGTDGVLLGAWASLASASLGGVSGTDGEAAGEPLRILDIGTGTGLLALMMAQRAASREWGGRAFSVTAVEREAAAAAQARENAAASPWASAVTVVTADIRTWRAAEAATYAAPLFDMIVCNPPFYTDSLKGPDAARNAARHDDGLKPDTLFRLAAAWLKPAPATFSLIFPADKAVLAVDTAARHGLQAVRQCRVFTAPAATRPTRVLLAFVRKDTLVRYGLPRESALSGSPFTENLWIYSEAFRALVQPFYLNM